MRPDILRAVIGREFAELVRNRLLLFTIIVPPALLTVAPLVVGTLVQGGERSLPESLLRQIIAQRPDWSSFSPRELAAAFAIQQFLIYFLILPAYIPLAVASFSIIGEKQSRSLEAVLATPIRTSELLAGKAVAALVPGLLAGWLTYVVFATLARIQYGPNLVAVVSDPSWLAGVFLLGPAIGLLSVVAGIIVSSRVNDPRTAQQIGGVIIVPIVALTILQSTGTIIVGASGYAVAAIVVAAVAVAGLRLGVALFGRETILTRWR
ncbi:MAG TPA: ABC transporter permease [Candidatus Limnocylindrales bacterium]|nr:ABC transporter permease [Candidatus Limnocylindrales bacterium]